MRTIGLSLGAGLGVLLGFACGDGGGGGQACAEDLDCGDAMGVRCEASGYCSAPDATCPTGFRYLDNAGAGLAGECVDPEGDDSPVETFDSLDDTGVPTSSTSGPTTAGSITVADTGPVCGNGIVEAGEECDDGNQSNTDACTTGCTFAGCTDGIANGDETDVDCGGPSCPACPACTLCVQDGDCEGGACSAAGTCQQTWHVELDWVGECSEAGGTSVEISDLPPGEYTARTFPSAATKWAVINPPASGWIYRIDCTTLVLSELRTPPGTAFFTPAEAYGAIMATQQSFTWEGGPVVCGLADLNCDDNQGTIVFDIEDACDGPPPPR